MIGCGVAGLQTIATARRIGAMVEAYDVRPETREQVLSMIQKGLADLAVCFGPDMRARIMQAANHVSISDYYKAMSELRAVLKYEAELMQICSIPRPEQGDAVRA